MKSLIGGILLIVVLGIGGFLYRNVTEHSVQTVSCPTSTLSCPDGTSVPHIGNTCMFPACPPPNVSIPEASIAFALPDGLITADMPDAASVAAYLLPGSAASTSKQGIVIRRYATSASSTVLAVIAQTAINHASGLPVNPTLFASTVINKRSFTVVPIDRFEGTIVTAYYLDHGTQILRFDAIDENTDWTNPNLNISELPAHAALIKLLGTLRGQ